jgi:hypothetical protein
MMADGAVFLIFMFYVLNPKCLPFSNFQFPTTNLQPAAPNCDLSLSQGQCHYPL